MSRWTRFFTRLPSETLLKYQAGSARFASKPPIVANSALLSSSRGRPRTADQKLATASTSPQSKATFPILAAMYAIIVGPLSGRTTEP
jgi:hypothetical protein